VAGLFSGRRLRRCHLGPPGLAGPKLSVYSSPESVERGLGNRAQSIAGQLAQQPATASQEPLHGRTQGRLETTDDSEALLARKSDGTVVLLRDVARGELAGLSYRQIGRYPANPSSLSPISLLAPTPCQVGQLAVKQLIAARKQTFPDDVTYADGAGLELFPVTRSILEIVKTLAEGPWAL